MPNTGDFETLDYGEFGLVRFNRGVRAYRESLVATALATRFAAEHGLGQDAITVDALWRSALESNDPDGFHAVCMAFSKYQGLDQMTPTEVQEV